MRAIGWAVAVMVLGSLAVARGQSTPDAAGALPDAGLAESPFKCVDTSPEAEFVVRVEHWGGYGGGLNAWESVRVARHAGRTTLRGAHGSWLVRDVIREDAIEDSSVAPTLKPFHDALRFGEKDGCRSDAWAVIKVSWCCGRPGEKPTSGALSYTDYGCGDHELGDPSQRSMEFDTHVRGAWLRRAVHGVLDGLLVNDIAMLRMREALDDHKARQAMEKAHPPAPSGPDWKAVAAPPPPPNAMLAEPCPAELKLRYSLSRAPEHGKPEAAQWMRDCVDADGRPHGRWSEWSHDGRMLRSTTWPEGAVIMPDASFIPPPGWIPRCRPGAGVVWQHEWTQPADGGWEPCRPDLPGY